MKIISYNVNGLQGILKKDENGNKGKFSPSNPLNNLMSKYDPDFLCLQEIRITGKILSDGSSCSDKFNHSKFIDYPHIYTNYCTSRKGYSGTMIATKHEPINVYYNFDQLNKCPTDEGLNSEGRLITLEYDKFFLLNVYVPNSGVKNLNRLSWRIATWEKTFRKLIRKLLKTGKYVIIVGDFNVCHEQLDTCVKLKENIQFAGLMPEERSAFSKLLNLGLTDSFRHLYPERKQYSWRFSAKTRGGLRLDYGLVSSESIIKKSGIIEWKGSDHVPIALKVVM